MVSPLHGGLVLHLPEFSLLGSRKAHLHHGVLVTSVALWSYSYLSLFNTQLGAPSHTPSHTAVPSNILLFLVGNSHQTTVGYWRAGNDDLVPLPPSAGHRQGGSKCQPMAESPFNVASRFLSLQVGYISDLCCLKSRTSLQGITPPFPQGTPSKDIHHR